eukprot:PLAT4151.1.p1 GENE.PLAT4151.1~~PLAT4151.1.p1  ORF type:complete len:298 (-),score=135.17 PLAT4151.1:105-977(-)
MDLLLQIGDDYLMDAVYDRLSPNWLATSRDLVVRQALSLYFLVFVGSFVLYFATAGLAYAFLFDKSLMKSKRFLASQVKQEIAVASWSLPIMNLLTLPIFILEVRGHSKLYDSLSEHSWQYTLFSIAAYLMFTDAFIYWIHRWLHDIPWAYQHIHKLHHRWKVSTPFASHAFHPVDGFLQSIPYHVFIFIFPFHKVIYVVMFILVNVWTVSIHDGNYQLDSTIVNTSQHHTDHHLYFNYNYGQYFTFWDRIGGSYRRPTHEGQSRYIFKNNDSLYKQRMKTVGALSKKDD